MCSKIAWTLPSHFPPRYPALTNALALAPAPSLHHLLTSHLPPSSRLPPPCTCPLLANALCSPRSPRCVLTAGSSLPPAASCLHAWTWSSSSSTCERAALHSGAQWCMHACSCMLYPGCASGFAASQRGQALTDEAPWANRVADHGHLNLRARCDGHSVCKEDDEKRLLEKWVQRRHRTVHWRCEVPACVAAA